MEDVREMTGKSGKLIFCLFKLINLTFIFSGTGKRSASWSTADHREDGGDREAQQLEALSFNIRVLKMSRIFPKCLFWEGREKKIFFLFLGGG